MKRLTHMCIILHTVLAVTGLAVASTILAHAQLSSDDIVELASVPSSRIFAYKPPTEFSSVGMTEAIGVSNQSKHKQSPSPILAKGANVVKVGLAERNGVGRVKE